MAELPGFGDGGGITRLARRTSAAAWAPIAVGVVTALTGWFWPGWAATPVGTVLAASIVTICGLYAAVLWHRAGLWARAERSAQAFATSWPEPPGSGWQRAVCGQPVPLHTGRGRVPMVRRERRLPASVLPVRSVTGVLATGAAVVVHARGDGAVPAPGDDLMVLVLGRRGPYLLARTSDGAVFAADRWLLSTG